MAKIFESTLNFKLMILVENKSPLEIRMKWRQKHQEKMKLKAKYSSWSFNHTIKLPLIIYWSLKRNKHTCQCSRDRYFSKLRITVYVRCKAWSIYTLWSQVDGETHIYKYLQINWYITELLSWLWQDRYTIND